MIPGICADPMGSQYGLPLDGNDSRKEPKLTIFARPTAFWPSTQPLIVNFVGLSGDFMGTGAADLFSTSSVIVDCC